MKPNSRFLKNCAKRSFLFVQWHRSALNQNGIYREYPFEGIRIMKSLRNDPSTAFPVTMETLREQSQVLKIALRAIFVDSV